MIDWINLFTNSLWIIGLSVALAALSYASWQSKVNRQSLRSSFEQPLINRMLLFAGSLVSLGLFSTSKRLWESGIWLLFTIIFLDFYSLRC